MVVLPPELVLNPLQEVERTVAAEARQCLFRHHKRFVEPVGSILGRIGLKRRSDRQPRSH